MKRGTYRLLTEADFAAVLDIWNYHIRAGVATLDEAIKNEDLLHTWLDRTKQREAMYVLEHEGVVIGFGIIRRYSERNGYRIACLTSLFLNADWTGKGFGTSFKKFLLQEAKHLGYRHVVNQILSKNVASIAYNLKLGFEVVGIQRGIGIKGEERIDITILQYVID